MRPPPGEGEAIPPTNQQPDDIGKRVPADRKGSQRNCNRIDCRKRDRKEWHDWHNASRIGELDRSGPRCFIGGSSSRTKRPTERFIPRREADEPFRAEMLIAWPGTRDTGRFSSCRPPGAEKYRPRAPR